MQFCRYWMWSETLLCEGIGRWNLEREGEYWDGFVTVLYWSWFFLFPNSQVPYLVSQHKLATPKNLKLSRVADPDPALGAFWPKDTGFRLSFSRILDLGSRIPSPFFWELLQQFFGIKIIKFVVNWLKLFSVPFSQKKKIFSFMKFIPTKTR